MKSGWKVAALGEVCRVYQPETISQKQMKAGDFPVYGANGQIGWHDRFNHEAPQLILGCRGSCGSVHRTAPHSWINGNAMVVQPRDGVIDTSFLAYALKGGIDIDDAITGAAQPQITRTSLMPVMIRFPIEIGEQKRIVGILDEAFAEIATAKAAAEKNLQNARALFESQLHAIDAKMSPLGELVNITTGKLDANAAVEKGAYPFFTCSKEVYAIDKYAFDCEAILLAGNNAVGDFNVKHFRGRFNAYQRTYVITVNEREAVLYRYLYYQMLRSLRKFKSQAVGAGTKFLKLGMIKDMEIPLPVLPEQQGIVSMLDALHEETQRLASLYERKLAALEELKKSLLHEAFSGNL